MRLRRAAQRTTYAQIQTVRVARLASGSQITRYQIQTVRVARLASGSQIAR